MFRISNFGFLIFLLLFASPASFAAGWLSIHGDDGNNACWAIPSQVTSLSAGASWDTGASELLPGAGMAWRGTTLYAVAMRDGGNYDPSDDKIWIKALNAADGTLAWQSPFLEAGNSASYASISGPAIDADGAIYYAAGRTMNKLSPTSGTIVWSTRLTSSTTHANASLELINSSPAIGAGKVFIETYDDYMGAYRDKQIVALNSSDGAIAWSRNDGGTGRIRPIFLSNVGTSGVVVTEVFNGTTSHGLAAYAAADGAIVWSHLTAPAPWSVAAPIEAPFISVAGRIYGVTYTGAGTGQLFCVDAATGSLVWKVNSIESDTAPLLMNGTIYLYGGPFGNSQLAAYRASDGGFIRATAIGGYCFRNAMAATNTHIYLTQSDFFGSDPTTDLVIVNAADGAIVDRVTATYGGPVMLDTLGGVYVHDTSGGIGGLRAFGKTVPVELSSFEVR